MTFEQRSKRGEGIRFVTTWGAVIQTGNSQGERSGPEAGGRQACWRKRKESGMAGESKVTVVGDKRGNRSLTE